MSLRARSLIRFGRFRLEVDRRTLYREEEPILLRPRVFDTLVVLAVKAGDIATKEEILDAVWPDTVVEENNLNQNVLALRRILERHPEDGVRIETVPRRGYRLIAPAPEDLPAPSAPAPTPLAIAPPPPVLVPQPSASHAGSTPHRAVIAAAAAAALLVAASMWLARRPAGPRAASSRSIAVLPLASIDQNPADEPLGVGIAEAVVSRLSRRRELVVRPLSSSRKAAQAAPNIEAAGARLGVDYLLEGTLQRSDGRVRANVHLIRVRDRSVLWSDSLEEPSAEAFRLEDTIAERLVGALGPEIGLTPMPSRARHVPASQAAYETYLRGRLAWNRRGASDLERAVAELESAVREDPGYALAWSGLADAYVLLGPSSPEDFPKARTAAERALGLDPELAEAHASLGFTRFFSDWDFAGSERELKRAIQLDPGYATAHQWYAYWLVATGRFEDAVAEIKRARDIDPLSLVLREDVGHILIYSRRYGEAIPELKQVLSVEPGFSKGHYFLFEAFLFAGRLDEAAAELPHLDGWPDSMQARVCSAQLTDPRKDTAQARTDEAVILQAAAAGNVTPDGAAATFARLGNKDLAFQWLDRAYRERRFYLVFLNVDPVFDPLRLDPRFASLVRRIGIPS